MSDPSLKKASPIGLTLQVPLARYTTWRVGGPAERLYLPLSLDDLQIFIRNHPEETWTWLGLGSNSLIRQGGIDGTVILTLRGLMATSQIDTRQIHVQAGVPCAKIARFAARAGLADAEFFAGIPGTLGGALRMNAGCHGDETWNHVIAVETINRQGEIHRRDARDFKISYRSVDLPLDEWFVAADLEFSLDVHKRAFARMNQLLEARAKTQPTSEYNAGSVFRNPPDDHAARLIEAAGLKGFCIGSASVSEKHANFIITTKDANAGDVEHLITEIKARVFEKFGLLLIPEVHILGKNK